MLSWRDASRQVAALERLLLPGECLVCQAPLPAREWDALVCALCRLRWGRVIPPWCERCGQPGLTDVSCRFCAGWDAALDQVRSACWLDGGAREAVHHLKYGGWPAIAHALAGAMRHLPLPRGGVLVPVPLGRRRLRRRGYNQARMLADALGADRGYPVLDVLQRGRDTRSQTALTPDARAANVRGAFVAGGAAEGTFVLVDDVCTTGATLTAAATALKAAGAARVEAITFARAPLPVELTS